MGIYFEREIRVQQHKRFTRELISNIIENFEEGQTVLITYFSIDDVGYDRVHITPKMKIEEEALIRQKMTSDIHLIGVRFYGTKCDKVILKNDIKPIIDLHNGCGVPIIICRPYIYIISNEESKYVIKDVYVEYSRKEK
jgi:hypothetical protein